VKRARWSSGLLPYALFHVGGVYIADTGVCKGVPAVDRGAAALPTQPPATITSATSAGIHPRSMAIETPRRPARFPYPRRMTAVDTDLVVLAVVTRWRVDAALLLVAGAAFFAAGAAGASFAGGVLSFVVGFVVGTLLERIGSTLPSSARLADAATLPDGARRGSVRRYFVVTVARLAALYALFAVVIWAWTGPHLYGWVGGWLAAHGVARLYGVARARGIEQRYGVVLLVGVGSWRNRIAGYYTAPPID